MMFPHQPKKLEEDVMPMLKGAHLSEQFVCWINQLALAVVVLHAGNAFAAASIACLVSAKPISGTVPNSSRVAGSIVTSVRG